MSTKIYEGLKLKNMSMYELNLLMRKVREEAIEIQKEVYMEKIAKKIADIYDLSGLIPKEALKERYDIVDNDINVLYHTINELKKYDFLNKFKCELVLIPIPDAILAIPLGDFRFMKLFRESKDLKTNEKIGPIFKEFEEYGYWDNTDKLEDITDKEWKKRKKDWHIALEGIGILSQNGILKTLAPSMINYEADDKTIEKKIRRIKMIEKALLESKNAYKVDLTHEIVFPEKLKPIYFPSKKERVKTIRNYLFEEIFYKKTSKSERDTLDFHEIYKKINEIKKHPIHQAEVEKKIKKIKLKKIPKDIDIVIDVDELYGHK